MRGVKAEEAALPSPETQVEMYRVLRTARMTDERCWLLNRGGQAPFVISCHGQDGPQAGGVFARGRPPDRCARHYCDLGGRLPVGQTPQRAITDVAVRA